MFHHRSRKSPDTTEDLCASRLLEPIVFGRPMQMRNDSSGIFRTSCEHFGVFLAPTIAHLGLRGSVIDHRPHAFPDGLAIPGTQLEAYRRAILDESFAAFAGQFANVKVHIAISGVGTIKPHPSWSKNFAL